MDLKNRLIRIGTAAGITVIAGYLYLEWKEQSKEQKTIDIDHTVSSSQYSTTHTTSTKESSLNDQNSKSSYASVLDENLNEATKNVIKMGIPKVGSGEELQPSYTAALWKFAEKTDACGLGISYIDMFGNPTIIATDPELVRKSLSHNVHHALWAGITDASTAFFGKNVLFVLEGEEWRFLRNLIKNALTKQNIKLMQLDLIETASKFADKIKPNVETDMNSVLNLYHLSAIGKSAFNFDLECLEGDNLGPNGIAKSFEFFIDELPRRSLNPDQSVLGDYMADNEDNRKWNAAKKNVRGTIETVIKNRFREYAGSDDAIPTVLNVTGVQRRYDLLDGMIFAYIAQKLGLKDDEEVTEINFGVINMKDLIETLSDNLVEIMFAGYNTNVGTISNMLHFLALNKDIQDDCVKEVDAFMRKFDIVSLYQFHKINSNFDLKHFNLIQNCFFETLRLRPPAPLVSRLVTKGTKVSKIVNSKQMEIELPENLPVWFPTEYLHQHYDNWANPDGKFSSKEFKPRRFDLPNCYKLGSFLPFSFGPRDCIGKNFAVNETVFAAIFLLKRFEFDVASNFKYKNFFNGFGYRPFDETEGKVCMRLIPRPRVNLSK